MRNDNVKCTQSVLVKVQDLKKYFDVSPSLLTRVVERKPRALLKAVDGVSFEIRRGETLALVGESGCGKSTTARMLVGLDKPTAGTVEVDGKDLYASRGKDEKLVRGKIQMIFQDPMASLNPRKKVRDILGEGLDIHHMYKSKEEREEKIKAILAKVGLAPEHAARYPHQFSGGQRQRIGIARALAVNPEFIIADEPVSALDVSIQAQILNLLMDLKDEFNFSYLFIAHDLSVVRFISDRIAVIYKGRIVELAEAEELFHHPLHPYTKALLSAVPIPDPEIEKKKKLLIYDPTLHDYTISKPQWVEITEGHFVYGNEPELEKYRAEIEAINAAERA